MDKKIQEVGGIFIIAAFFAFISWLGKIADSDVEMSGRVKVKGFTHSLTSALISVTAFELLKHFYPDWQIALQGSIAVVCGALLSEALIKFATRRIDNDKLI